MKEKTIKSKSVKIISNLPNIEITKDFEKIISELLPTEVNTFELMGCYVECFPREKPNWALLVKVDSVACVLKMEQKSNSILTKDIIIDILKSQISE